MLHLLTGLAIVAFLVLGLVRGALWVLRRNRECSTCRAPLVPVTRTESQHTYEVLHCPKCSTAVTLALGQRARFAWCPQCRQRALEAPAIRLPAPTGQIRVEVREQCHLCGYRLNRIVEGQTGEEAPRPKGQILTFPGSDQHVDGDEGP